MFVIVVLVAENIACSRVQDSGEKSFSKKKKKMRKTREGWGETGIIVAFTSPPYFLRAWHRLLKTGSFNNLKSLCLDVFNSFVYK